MFRGSVPVEETLPARNDREGNTMKNTFNKTACRYGVYALSVCLVAAAGAQKPAGAPVTVTDDGTSYILSNGIVTAHIEKKSGDIISYQYKGTEMTATLPVYPAGVTPGRETGYWAHDAKSENTTAKITIDPASNGGQMAEVEVKAISGGKAIGDGPGGTIIADIDIHWALARGESGVYTYMQMEHQADYPPTVLGESRFCIKIADFFDWMSVGPKWDKPYPKAAPGMHEDKYDFTADQFENPAYGWSSTTKNIGFWFINPSVEYLSGGPTKVEFLGHRDTNTVQAPTVLNYWRSSHYGGAVADAAQGEHWVKVVGPFMLYVNSGGDHAALYKDAIARAHVEQAKWPYAWVNGVEYPHKAERATVSGHLILKDPLAKGAKDVEHHGWADRAGLYHSSGCAGRSRFRGSRNHADGGRAGAVDRLADGCEALRVLGAGRCERQLQADQRAARQLYAARHGRWSAG